MKMSSDLLFALDAEESSNGKGFATADIKYGNGDDVKSSDKEEDDDDDEIIIVDKEKQTYSLKTIGPLRPQPPLSRLHKDAQDFSSKALGRIPKISSPLPKAKDGVRKSYQPYQPSNTSSGSRQGSQKRTYNNSAQKSPARSPETTQQQVSLYKSYNSQKQPVFIVSSPGSNIVNTNLIQGVLQITESPGQTGGKTYRIIRQNQHMKVTSSETTEIVELNTGLQPDKHSSNALPCQMTPAPVKVRKLQVVCSPLITPSTSSATEDSTTENDDDEKDVVQLALCANCGIKSRSLSKCDSCKCDFSGRKYKKLIPISKDDAIASKNNTQLRSGPFVSQNFYSNKSNSFLLPVKRLPPRSTSTSDNWKEPFRLKTYSQRRQKKTVEPVCISISSDEEDELMSQDEGMSNDLDNDSNSRSPTFERLAPLTRSNGRKEPDSVFTDDETDSELKSNSHHRTDDLDSGSGFNTPRRVSRKQKMRNQDEQLMGVKEENSIDVKLKDEDLSDCSLDNEDITVQDGLRCVTVEATLVRIGSQEYKSRTSVEFQWNQIVVHLNGNLSPSKRLELKTNELVSCVFFLSSSLFKIIVKTIPAAGVRIRERLNMDSQYRYDPGSSDESQKTINIHVNKVTENDMDRLRKLIESYQELNIDMTCSEVNCKDIDILLEKYTPATQTVDKSQQESSFNWDEPKPTSISTDQLLPSVTNRVSTIKPRVQLVYPPNETKGRISVTSEDVSCLQKGEFINDVIIDFYLKYLLQEVLTEEARERTHIFSSFFYKRLSRRVASTSKSEVGPQRSVAERRHSHVKSWTRNVDLFEKDFIVIPVNESAHWYVAIVCFPGLSKPGAITSDLQAISLQGTLPNQDSLQSSQLSSNNIENSATNNPTDLSSGKLLHQEQAELTSESDNISDGERMDVAEPESSQENSQIPAQNGEQLINDTSMSSENEGDQGKSDLVGISAENEVNCSDDVQEAIGDNEKLDTANKLFHVHQNYPYKQPCILIFDSLKGTSKRSACISKLKEYLSVEWNIKMDKRREFDFKGMQPEVPQQSNYHDCGVYVLQYVESFFTMPIKNFSSPLKGLSEWFSEEEVSCKREGIKMLISNLAELHKGKR